MTGDGSGGGCCGDDAAELERVLCFNVLLDESRRDVGVFRHPIYSYSERLAWPPPNWRSIYCWHCCHRFDEEPVPLPQTHDRKTDCFSVFGVFCSWPCAKQYQNEHQNWTSGERTLLLEDMARDAFGYKGPPIQAAPPRHRLIMFGGDLSIDAFRQEHGYSNSTLRPPLLSFPEIYERLASAGCEGDTAPSQWSVRGLRSKSSPNNNIIINNNVAATTAIQSTTGPSPYERFLSTRQTSPVGGGGLSSFGVTTAPNTTLPGSMPKTGTKRHAPVAEPNDAGTLQRFLKK